MNIALILSGGTGVRLGAGVPKQYISVQGKPIISYCIEKISAHAQIDARSKVAEGLKDLDKRSRQDKEVPGLFTTGCKPADVNSERTGGYQLLCGGRRCCIDT